MAMGLPLLAEQLQGALGQGHVAITVAFALTDVEQHAPGINVAHVQPQPFSQTQSAGVNGGQTDPVIKALDFAEDVPNLKSGEDDRQFELRVGAD